jgi:DNA-binding CsgD family transcriptional regulator
MSGSYRSPDPLVLRAGGVLAGPSEPVRRMQLGDASRTSEVKPLTIRDAQHAEGLEFRFGFYPFRDHAQPQLAGERHEPADQRSADEIRVDTDHERAVEFWLPDARPASSDGRERRRPSAAITSARAQEKTSAGESASDPARLSPRELEVAKLPALGHTNVEIGEILHLSVRTVEHHRSRVFRKLRVHSRAGLVQALREQPDSGSD